MFLVINKNKIYTYIVTICTVVVLFVLSFAMLTTDNNTVVTSGNVINEMENADSITSIMNKTDNNLGNNMNM